MSFDEHSPEVVLMYRSKLRQIAEEQLFIFAKVPLCLALEFRAALTARANRVASAVRFRAHAGERRPALSER
jgi:hypothetical protein